MLLGEISEDLTDFGLTGNQAKVYIALVKLGVASTSQITQLSKVRREEVYRLMPKLQQLGLIEKILGKPIKYKSVPPKEALSVLFKREREGSKRKMAELTEKRRRLLKQLKPVRAKRIVEEEPRFVLILDRDQALSKMAVMIRSAKREIDVVTSEYGLRYGYTIYADPVMKAIRKGVKVRFLSEINKVDELILKVLNEIKLHGNFVEMRHAANLTSSILIVDNSGVFVGIPLKPTMKKHADLWTNSPAYVDAMKTFFDRIWQDSVDIKSRIEYLQTGKPVERTLVLKDPKEAYEKSLELFGSAKEEMIAMSVPRRLIGLLRNYPFTEIREKGIKFRLLVPITKENVSEAKELLKIGELKHSDSINMSVGIIDRKHLFLFRTPPPDISRDPEYKEHFKEMVYSNDQRYVEGMTSIMEQLWDMGVDGRERIMELETSKPVGRVSKPIMEYISKNQKTKM